MVMIIKIYRDNLADRSPIGKVSKNGKDDNASEDWGQRVAQAHDKGIPEHYIHYDILFAQKRPCYDNYCDDDDDIDDEDVWQGLWWWEPVAIVVEVIVAWESQLTSIPKIWYSITLMMMSRYVWWYRWWWWWWLMMEIAIPDR